MTREDKYEALEALRNLWRWYGDNLDEFSHELDDNVEEILGELLDVNRDEA